MKRHSSELLDVLKSLADESRLKILRYLNEREHTVGELAERVGLGEPTVSHHLARLRKSELVTLRMDGNLRHYRMNQSGLDHFKQMVMNIEEFPPEPETVELDDSWIDQLGWDEEDLKVLRDHTINTQLTHLPTKQKKLLVILRWLATLFEADTFYTEQEINSILKSAYETDYVGLRRDLVDMGYLHRERGGGKYWLAPADENTSE